MWGTQVAERGLDVEERFIPTHVGNTGNGGAARERVSVHPHACGEHFCLIPYPTSLHGSSPRMWGTLNCLDVVDNISRFIPTHVGNTRDTMTTIYEETVHPHACGEHLSQIEKPDLGYGSSPRMWGTPGNTFPHHINHWFIPTHVGNTDMSWYQNGISSVHPHACGEHLPP